MKTLYEALLEEGLVDPEPQAAADAPLVERACLTGKAFAEAVLTSEEFRLYIIEGLTNRDLPPAVLCRLMDHGWGKAPDRVEHTGKDGEPIVTEVRRVIVHKTEHDDATSSQRSSYTTH